MVANNVDMLAANGDASTFKTTVSSNVHIPHNNARLFVAGLDVANSNPVPTLPVLANGTPVGSGANGLPVIVSNTIVYDNGPNWTTVWGSNSISGPFVSADASAAPANVSVSPTSGQKIVLDDLLITAAVPLTVTLKCETSGQIVAGPINLAGNTPFVFTPRGKGIKLGTADKKLQAQTSVSGSIMILAGYHSEA